MPNAIPEKPWSHISADFITKLLLAQRYNTILVVCDWFSKIVYFIATIEKILAEELARLFRNHIWKLQTSRKHYIRQRSAVYSRNDEGVEQVVRDTDKTVYSLPSPDKWADRKSKPEVGTVSKGLYQPQARTVARLVRNY